MRTNNNICMNMNLMYKDPKGDILHHTRDFRELPSESYGKKRKDKIKVKARTCSMHLKNV